MKWLIMILFSLPVLADPNEELRGEGARLIEQSKRNARERERQFEKFYQNELRHEQMETLRLEQEYYRYQTNRPDERVYKNDY